MKLGIHDAVDHESRTHDYPRVVNLFIVPYQGGKGLTGAGDTIPVLGFASFYVMNWTGNNNNRSDPCPDTTFDQDHNPLTPQINLPNPPAGAITACLSKPSTTNQARSTPRPCAKKANSHPAESRSFGEAHPYPVWHKRSACSASNTPSLTRTSSRPRTERETSRQSRVSADHGRRRDVPGGRCACGNGMPVSTPLQGEPTSTSLPRVLRHWVRISRVGAAGGAG